MVTVSDTTNGKKRIKTRSKPLSAAFVRTAKTPGRYGDGGRGSHGLYLRVWARANGRIGKAWAQRIRISGRPTNLGLGVYPVVTLAEARAKALENRRTTARGSDPRGGGIPTFAEAAEKVIRLHANTWKPGSRLPAKWRQTLRDYAYPIMGHKPVGEVKTGDVMAVVTPIWTSKPAVARVVRQRIGAVMKWAVAKGYRQDNPAGDAIGAALPRNGGHVHHKALPHREVGAALRKVRACTAQPAVRLALEFVVLTAARLNEVLGARWSEIEGSTWTVPAARMKGKREHRVPLSGRALGVLRDARELSGGAGLIFPSRRTGKTLSSPALREVLRRLDIPGTVHGFRSSFRDWCSENAVAREVAEAALAHKVRNQTEAAYARSDLLERRREVMEDWARYITV